MSPVPPLLHLPVTMTLHSSSHHQCTDATDPGPHQSALHITINHQQIINQQRRGAAAGAVQACRDVVSASVFCCCYLVDERGLDQEPGNSVWVHTAGAVGQVRLAEK